MSDGYNDSERYLSQLCKQSFLSLWSFNNLFKQPGHELCDALIVVGNKILIFSDKMCQFKDTGNLDVDWKKWFRHAIEKSAKQLWGARNWIERDRNRIFFDPQCKQHFKLDLTRVGQLEYHLIAVAHGASHASKAYWNGTGGLAIHRNIKGFKNHTSPFEIGDLDPDRHFIHVLDDVSLEIVLENLDTITDFLNYISRREKLLRGEYNVWAYAEGDMLSHYLSIVDENSDHFFDIPAGTPIEKTIEFQRDDWHVFENHPKRIAKLKADEVSYFWDALIEKFSFYAATETQQHISKGGFSDSEEAIRHLALENRLNRRILAMNLVNAMQNTPSKYTRKRVWFRGHFCYVFVLFPGRSQFNGKPETEYREVRRYYLEAVCRVCRLIRQELQYAIGIAIESGSPVTYTEDLLIYHFDDWSEEEAEVAKQDQIELNILTSGEYGEFTHLEYPEIA